MIFNRKKNTALGFNIPNLIKFGEDGCIVPSAVNDWMLDNQYDFIKAWIAGYEVETDETK